MTHHNMVDDLMTSRTVGNILGTFRSYFKWIVAGVVVVFVLVLLVLALIVIGLLNWIVRPALNQAPDLQNQGQQIMQEGQKWWEQRFNQEQQQLQEIKTELDAIKNTLDTERVLQPETNEQ